MTIGENIRRIRKEKGLTQKELGNLCNLADSAIRRYELGGANPKLETVEKIAQALDVPIREIMENLTLQEHKKTNEYRKLELFCNARDSILSILANLYGNAERKEMYGGSVDPYYVIGEGTEKFFLQEKDIDILLTATNSNISSIVEILKDTRSEIEIIEEYITEFGESFKNEFNGEYGKLYEEFLRNQYKK